MGYGATSRKQSDFARCGFARNQCGGTPRTGNQRIIRFAERVGRENVIASTDCGLGGRVHPQIANAKLETLAKGAALATEYLWGQDAVTPAGALSKTVH